MHVAYMLYKPLWDLFGIVLSGLNNRVLVEQTLHLYIYIYKGLLHLSLQPLQCKRKTCYLSKLNHCATVIIYMAAKYAEV